MAMIGSEGAGVPHRAARRGARRDAAPRQARGALSLSKGGKRDRRPGPSNCSEGRGHALRACFRSTSLESSAAARFRGFGRRRPSKGSAASGAMRGAAERLRASRRTGVTRLPKNGPEACDGAGVHATPGRVRMTVSRRAVFPRRVRRLARESFSGAPIIRPLIARCSSSYPRRFRKDRKR